MKLKLIVGALIFIWNPAFATCFNVDKAEPKELTGTLEFEIFPGPPNFISVKDGDMPEPAYILTLHESICIQGSDAGGNDDEISAVHLITNANISKKMKASIGKTVDVGLSESMIAMTGHHHAPLVSTVTNIKIHEEGDITDEYGTSATVIRAFYYALSFGQGDKAVEYIVPEKRQGAFDPDALTKFYGNMSEPLKLDSIKPLSDDKYSVKYSYKKGESACDGEATVDMVSRNNESLIMKIKALNGC
ncbi:hypothetical protein J9253_04755 [Thiothrix litoralis]|uniref:DUF4431 domain-containing protein n=1 Tax=Thiothrix litoralis TaxID=2891210 RepID=A0ABX7WXY5_9GAMM|nr:hypothetical protein [Thiothrix litoralis]QTR47253.1 hypothetical protein J9253_04755 [Thiothrix litoralis]